jgi:hypothetical protein
VLVGLGRAELQFARHLGDRFRDGEPAAPEVDAAHAQGGQLAEAQPGVGEQSDDVAVIARRGGESFDVLPAEEPRLVPSDAGERQPVGRVARDAPVSDGESEEQGEDAVRLTDGGRCGTVRAEAGDPAGDLGVGDFGQPVAAPGGQDVGAQQAQVAELWSFDATSTASDSIGP